MLVGNIMMPEPIMFTATSVVSPMRFIFLLESAIGIPWICEKHHRSTLECTAKQAQAPAENGDGQSDQLPDNAHVPAQILL